MDTKLDNHDVVLEKKTQKICWPWRNTTGSMEEKDI